MLRMHVELRRELSSGECRGLRACSATAAGSRQLAPSRDGWRTDLLQASIKAVRQRHGAVFRRKTCHSVLMLCQEDLKKFLNPDETSDDNPWIIISYLKELVLLKYRFYAWNVFQLPLVTEDRQHLLQCVHAF